MEEDFFLGHQDDEEVLVVEGVVHRLAGGVRCSEERVQYRFIQITRRKYSAFINQDTNMILSMLACIIP